MREWGRCNNYSPMRMKTLMRRCWGTVTEAKVPM